MKKHKFENMLDVYFFVKKIHASGSLNAPSLTLLIQNSIGSPLLDFCRNPGRGGLTLGMHLILNIVELREITLQWGPRLLRLVLHLVDTFGYKGNACFKTGNCHSGKYRAGA